MLKKLFATMTSVAMLFCMSISSLGVHAEEIIYPTGTTGSGKGTFRNLIEIGVPYNLDEYVKGIVLPENATVNEKTIEYSLKEGSEELLTINDDRTVIANEEGSGTIYANFKNSEGELTGNRVAIYTVATTKLTAFRYRDSSATYAFDPAAETHYVTVTNELETEPYNAMDGIYFTDIEYSTSDESIAYYEYDINRGLRLIAKKPGDVTVYAKYKDFTASYQLHIYEEKGATKMECPDEFVTYPGYYPPLEVKYGEKENRATKVEIIEGGEFISNPVDGVYNNGSFNVMGVAPGKTVMRLTSVSNPSLTKVLTVNVLDGAPDPKDNYTLNVYEHTDNGLSLIPQSSKYDLVLGNTYTFEFNAKYGYDKTLPKFDPPYKLTGGSTGDVTYTFVYSINKMDSYDFAFPVYPITFNVVEKTIEKPPVDTGSAEDTKVEVADTVSKEDAAVITETLSKAEVTSVVSTIKPAAKETLIKELTKDIDTTGKEVSLTVVNTVKVTAADLKSEKKSITYEISPKAVVSVDGVVVNTADLKNDQLTGKKDIEVTLPINGLDLKEIVHKSEGYDPEYIYDFVVSKEGTVTFKISHFSSFTLNEVITKPAESSTGTVSPNTGDHTDIMMYGGVGIIAAMCAVALILFRRKHA